ncbi:hypothetical protein [Nocardioides sp.]|uniref:hypothetical protein n=1 Tax=Nocardioides sp. TaxID=35761 RepID=UPI002625E118|nr:hypothetical protein [Nocardioides sp.]
MGPTVLGQCPLSADVWFFARPEGQTQFFGSWLPVWDDLLPAYPDDLAQRDAELVVETLNASLAGGSRSVD